MQRRPNNIVLSVVVCCLFWAMSAIADNAVAADAPPRATAVRIGHDGKTSRFVVDLSYAVGFNVFVLPDPFRVIVDLPETNFDIPANRLAAAAGVISSYRFGSMDAERSRIVMDVSRPVLINRSFILPQTDAQPAKLVVDLVETDHQTFTALHSVEQPSAPPAPETAAAAVGDEKDATLPAHTSDVNVSTAAEQASHSSMLERARAEVKHAIQAMLQAEPVPVPRPRPSTEPNSTKQPVKAERPAGAKRVVVIDPGHGGIDPGAVSRSGAKEKSIVLAFARQLRTQLENTGKYEVILTRDKDVFVSLHNRVRIARTRNADLFLAIHADSIRGRRASGATIYTVSEKASDQEAAELARKENRSDIIAGVDLGEETNEITGILIDLAQRETNNHSLFFAKKMLQQVKSVTKMNARPLRSAGFRVLKAPDVPSVLFELGYLSNKADERKLTSQKWQRKTAAALAGAVDRYFSTRLAAR